MLNMYEEVQFNVGFTYKIKCMKALKHVNTKWYKNTTQNYEKLHHFLHGDAAII